MIQKKGGSNSALVKAMDNLNEEAAKVQGEKKVESEKK